MTVIKELKTMNELKLMQQIESIIWEMSPIPVHQTFTAVKNGGIVLAAFEKEEIIGFCYSFTGFKNGKSYLCSHMLAIDPEYRSRNIGAKLKLKQREIAIDKGYDLMIWTYDPLETRNAYLNLTKLSAVCNTYIENCYGEMVDGMNKGLPSDRFEVRWHLKSDYVSDAKRLGVSGRVPLNTVRNNSDGLLEFVGVDHDELSAQVYSLFVPKDFQRLKSESPSLALDWRFKTRRKFQELFHMGYSAVRLVVHDECAEYIFVKTDDLKL